MTPFSQLLPAIMSSVFALGIWWHHSFFNRMPLIIFTFVLLMSGCYYVYQKKLPYVLIFLIASFAIGAIRYRQEINFYKNIYATLNDQLCDIRATVTDIQTTDHPYFKKQITIKVTRIKISDRWKAITFGLQLNLPTLEKDITVADTIKISDLQMKLPTNIGFKKYLMRKGIVASLFKESIAIITIKKPYWSINRLIHQARASIAESLQTKIPRKVRSLFFSIFLGKRTNKHTSMLRQHCKIWGISHYLARSGLHLILFICIWQLFLNLFPFSTNIKTIAAMILSILYCMLSWPSVSFSRALYTFLLHQLCKLVSLPSSSTRLLGIVCFLTLLINPHHLFFIDFQLSFTLAFAIAWYALFRYSMPRSASDQRRPMST